MANGSSILERSKGSAGVARERMTHLSRTTVIPQLASTSLRALYKHGQRVQFTSPLVGGDVGRRALLQLSGEGKDSAAMDAGRPQNVHHPTLSRKRSDYIEALIIQ